MTIKINKNNVLRAFLIVLTLVVAAAPATHAQSAGSSRPVYPCENGEGFKDFDFWIGAWDVHLANGDIAGSNVIQREERGCVLTERWTSANGGTDAEGGSQINIRGGLTDEGMAMEGTIHYVANGTTAPFRALWTPLPDGRVRQYFEQSNDGGETWVPWFEGFYTRKAD
jgi:hypothetical protein